MSSEEEKIHQNKPLTQEEQINDYKRMVKQRLMTGYYGLAKTFWLIWFIPFMVLNLIDYMSTNTNSLLRVAVLSLIWSTLCLLFVSKTKSLIVWKVAALFVIACDVVVSALVLLAFFL